MQYQGSISRKLTIIILLVATITSFIGYGSFVYWYMKNQYNQSLELSKTAGDIIGQDVAKLILLNDVSAAADITMNLRSFQNLNKMVLYKKNSDPIFQYSKDNKKFTVAPLPNDKENISLITENKLIIFTKADYQGNHLGYIKLEFHVNSLFDVIKENIAMLLFILFIMFVLSLVLASFFAKQFTEPILKLVSFLEQIIKLDSLDKRVYTNEQNEYGILYNEINTMLKRIQKSQQAINIAAVAFETPSGMAITNKDGTILQINESYTKITGYSVEETLGNTPSMLKSGIHDKEFYQNMHDALHKDRYWSGEIINKHKNGDMFTEYLTIQAVVDKNDEIQYFVSSFTDITLQKKTEKMLQEKEMMLIQQSKMASMGEMLENIAHQWRQPLSIISTVATGQITKKQLEIPLTSEEEIEKYMKINDTVQYLSQTITDFRNFFNPNKTKKEFQIKSSYEKTLNLVNSKFKSIGIEVIENIDDNITINNLENELIQVLMNLFNNAKDILEEQDSQEKLIFVDTQKNNSTITINFSDNGGGVPDDIINKVFEPYFTTKYEKQGTGIGLYMSKEMVEKHMGGKIQVQNVTTIHNDKEYFGARFSVILPI
jgi:PAS domain S-box-containing protein